MGRCPPLEISSVGEEVTRKKERSRLWLNNNKRREYIENTEYPSPSLIPFPRVRRALGLCSVCIPHPFRILATLSLNPLPKKKGRHKKQNTRKAKREVQEYIWVTQRISSPSDKQREAVRKNPDGQRDQGLHFLHQGLSDWLLLRQEKELRGGRRSFFLQTKSSQRQWEMRGWRIKKGRGRIWLTWCCLCLPPRRERDAWSHWV